jgi:predicted PurR-regulated permease PerM
LNRVLANPWVRVVLALVAVALLGAVLLRLAGVLTPFAVAFALAWLLNPGVNALEGSLARRAWLSKRVDPRTVAVWLLVIGVAAALTLAVALAVPALLHQIADAGAKLPGYARVLLTRVEPLIERLSLKYPTEAEEVRKRLQAAAQENWVHILNSVVKGFTTAFSRVLGFVLSFLNLIVIPVVTIYLLYDMNHIKEAAKALVPPRFRGYVFSRGDKVAGIIAAFVRGQITVAVILGVFYAIALTACGVPMGLPVGFLVGFFNLIPFMCYLLGLPLALLLSWLDDPDPTRLLVVAVVFTVGQFVETNFVTPRIVGDRLGLPAVVIVLLAVPVTAALAVFLADLRDLYLKSAFYQAEAPPGAGGQA